MKKKSIYIVAGLAIIALVAGASLMGPSDELQGRFSVRSAPTKVSTKSISPATSSSSTSFVDLSSELDEIDVLVGRSAANHGSFENTYLGYFEGLEGSSATSLDYDALESKHEQMLRQHDSYQDGLSEHETRVREIHTTAKSSSGALASSVKTKAQTLLDEIENVSDEYEDIANAATDIYNELYLPPGDLQVMDAELYIAGDYVVINATIKNNKQGGKTVRPMSPEAVNVSGGLNLGSDTLYFAEKFEDTTLISSGQSTTVSVEIYPYDYGSELDAWVEAYLEGSSEISADLRISADHDNAAAEHNESNNELSTRITSF